MTTPLMLKRRRNKDFEQLAGMSTKYVRPHDAAVLHPVSYLLAELEPETREVDAE